MTRPKNRITSIASLLTAALLLASCGGGGVSNSNAIQITWPNRSRQPIVVNLSSALSAKITLSRADNSGTPVILNVDRTNSPNSYTGSYALPTGLDPLLTKLSVIFYSQAGGGGTEVGSATANVTITNGVPILDTVVVDGTIKSVAVIPATLSVGAPASQLSFTALDASNNTVAVSTGSGKWALVSGGAVLGLTTPGMATPKTAGNATVTVAVDGITSPEGNITVQNFSGQVTWEEVPTPGFTHGIDISAVHGNSIVGYQWLGTYDSRGDVNYGGATVAPNMVAQPAFSQITATDGVSRAGYLKLSTKHDVYFDTHAILQTDSTTTDLDPGGACISSGATAVSGEYQGGFAQLKQPDLTVYQHAVVWHGTANTMIDITPDSMATQFMSVSKMDGNLIVATDLFGSDKQSYVWTSPSKLSFMTFLPSNTIYATVFGLDSGRLVGWIRRTIQSPYVPVLWHSADPNDYVELPHNPSSTYAGFITDNYIVGSEIWNTTSLQRYSYPTPQTGVYGIKGIKKTAAGLDIIYSGAEQATAGKILIEHIPTNLLP